MGKGLRESVTNVMNASFKNVLRDPLVLYLSEYISRYACQNYLIPSDFAKNFGTRYHLIELVVRLSSSPTFLRQSISNSSPIA